MEFCPDPEDPMTMPLPDLVCFVERLDARYTEMEAKTRALALSIHADLERFTQNCMWGNRKG